MKRLDTKDWLVLNNIIYKIYTTEDLTEMRQTLFEQLKMVLDFDSGDFFLWNPHGKSGLASPVTYNWDGMDTYYKDSSDCGKGIMYGSKSLVYRDTDIISDEKRVEYYSLRMILAREKQFLGVVTFYRTIGKDNFEYDDIFLLDMLKDHLAYRLHQPVKNEGGGQDKISIVEAVKKYELTKREETILSLLLEGMDNTAISGELVISVNTLKKHILHIYRKLGIKNRVQMFKMIRERG